jgi:type IV pilus assembly protein PilC
VEDLETRIRTGSMLPEALVRHPGLFSGVHVNMVKAGESAGVLDTILGRLADAREKEVGSALR